VLAYSVSPAKEAVKRVSITETVIFSFVFASLPSLPVVCPTPSSCCRGGVRNQLLVVINYNKELVDFNYSTSVLTAVFRVKLVSWFFLGFLPPVNLEENLR